MMIGRIVLVLIAGLGLGLGLGLAAHAADDAAAESLARKSGCLKCHAIDKKKDGPSIKEIAGKWKGKADAEQKLTTHITSAPKVKIDGKEEEHEPIKTKNSGEIQNLIQWMLSR